MSMNNIKELRDKTGAGLVDCKKALTANDGDIEAATVWLGENGIIEQGKQKRSLFYIFGINTADLFVQKGKTDELKKQTSEMEKQKKIKETTQLMSGNPLGFLGFMSIGGGVQKDRPVVVGERGAEVFVPNQTGQITQSARGTGGGAVNVNFTINAVDASGIDRLLVERRGTISRIINESVNERGSSNLI